jgi:oligopeptide/dipeptide ABC transporter ATP-binding protein
VSERVQRDVVLKAEHVKKYFPIRGLLGNAIGHVKAVDDVSLELYRGETYGLVGESGCGKSTLGRTLVKLLDATAGRIEINGCDITKMSRREMRTTMRKKVQMIFQDPYTSLNPRMRIGDILTETLSIQNVGEPSERMDMVIDMLDKVGLRIEHYYRFPHELSGGQRQRVGFARAIILNPDIVICDEPVSALDVSVRSQIINLLLDMQEDRGLTYLFISHDMSVIRYTSRRTGVMYLGHIVEEAVTDDLFADARHPYTQVLLSAVPSPNPHVKKNRIVLEGDLPSPINPPKGCVFHTRCPSAMAVCREEYPPEVHVTSSHMVACHRYA